MKIVIVEENERVYTPYYGVPTIHLGDGLTAISDIVTEEGLAGVCFSELESGSVGDDVTEQTKGKNVVEIGAYFQILTDNPASLDVLIEKLKMARDALLLKYYQCAD